MIKHCSFFDGKFVFIMIWFYYVGTLLHKLEAVEAIVFDWNMSGDNNGFSANVFENMKNLRLLYIHRNFICCELTFLLDELRWLGWYCYPFSSLLPLPNCIILSDLN